MDLLSPCRSCLLCLPFFHDSPPSSPRHAAAAAPSTSSSPEEASNGADPPHGAENLPCPDAVHAKQAQAVSPPNVEAEGKAAHSGFEAGIAGKSEGDHWMATESDVTAPALSGIVIAPPVSANCSGAFPAEDTEQNKGAAMSDEELSVPFINDITFAPPGFLPLPSPITPAPFGSGYPAGEYPLHHQIYQGQQQEHQHPHGIPENPHHDHNYSPQSTGSHHEVGHRHDLSHDHGYEHGTVAEHVGSHHGHGRDHEHSEVPLSEQSFDTSKASDELCKGDDSVQHIAPHHNHDSAMALHDTVYKEEEEEEDDDDVEDTAPTPCLGMSPSTPELGSEAKVDNSESSAMSPTKGGAPALVESYHSEPMVLLSEDIQDDDSKAAHADVLGQHSASHGAARQRRRENFKHQLKGIKQQIRQGGLHIKEEGSKHMQTIMENMNKHAQQLGESRSFSMIPRANKN